MGGSHTIRRPLGAPPRVARGAGAAVVRTALVSTVFLLGALALGGMPPGRAAAASPITHTALTSSPTTPHVMVIVEENQEIGSINSATAPYLTSLANTYASAANWFAVEHNSPLDYMDLLSGNNQGCCANSPYSATTLVDELHANGITWKAYMENMASSCTKQTDSSGLYATIHNPFRYFTNYTTSAAGWCSIANQTTEGVLPYPGASGLVSALNGANAPDFVWITPNECNDMHGQVSTCKNSSNNQLITAGDTWLSTNLANVITSNWFKQNGTVIITWDEGTTGKTCCKQPGGGHIATVVISSNNKGLGSFTGTGDHFGTLAAIEKAYGVTLLGQSATAINGDLSGAFGAPTTGTISGTVTDAVTGLPIAGATVSYPPGSGSTTTTTASDGTYTLANVAPGTYTVTASDTGYVTQSPTNVLVSSGATTTQNLRWPPIPARSRGR